MRVSPGATTLAVIDVTKRYGARVALDSVSLSVPAGEVLGLLGPNGAGKSTLVSIVAGLRNPDAGAVRVDGIDVVADPPAARARVGLAPQDTGLYEVLTVRENLQYFAELSGLRRRGCAARVDELADALGLAALMDRTAFALSGGERRRLHTAIAFLHRPPLLLLDEPTVGADIETRAALLELVRAAAYDGAAIVYSTHYLPEVETLGASVAMLLRGRVIAAGRLAELVSAHGRAGVQVSFDDGDVMWVDAPDPERAVAAVVGGLGNDVARIRGVEIVRPSLDSVFLALTGRRYDIEDARVPAA